MCLFGLEKVSLIKKSFGVHTIFYYEMAIYNWHYGLRGLKFLDDNTST